MPKRSLSLQPADQFFGIFALLCCCALFGSCALPSALTLDEASGVVKCDDALLIVDDFYPGAYFRLPLEGDAGPILKLNPSRIERVDLSAADYVQDLEGIEILGDGRIVVLSERQHALFSESGMVAQYDNLLAEIGGRGLEGIAVKRMPEGDSRIAVVWEGGYMQPEIAGGNAKGLDEQKALKPIIMIHDLPRGKEKCRVPTESSRLMTGIELPLPDGTEPKAQRFRIPDLVWCKLGTADTEKEGFILLLSSMSGTDRTAFQYHWLQRYSLNGSPVGDPLDLDAVAPERLKGVNWEGLAWFEEGKSLVLIHERGLCDATYAFVIQIPDEWKVP